MTDLQRLIDSHPLTAKECGLAGLHRYGFALRVKDYAYLNNIGDFAFDSVPSLMAAIESHLRAKNPPPITEEEIANMRWKSGVGLSDVVYGTLINGKCFYAMGERERDDAITAHNADIDRLAAEIRRLRAKCGEVQS